VNMRHTPASVAAPFGPYSHAVEVPEGSRLLYISGEVGVLPDGTVPENIEAQAEACWQNIIAILADAGMDVEDLVKITTFWSVRRMWLPPARQGPNTSPTHVPARQRSSSKHWSTRRG
jgi:2-iminobutanoate/2-iminopropanoate deaminase